MLHVSEDSPTLGVFQEDTHLELSRNVIAFISCKSSYGFVWSLMMSFTTFLAGSDA